VKKKKQLDAVLLSYNLFAIIDFPTRSQFQTSTIIDNIFIDTYKFTNCTVHPLHNGLSDHDVQLLKIKEINLKQRNQPPDTIRNINKFSIEDFK
jgi:phage anti-repressor protein